MFGKTGPQEEHQCLQGESLVISPGIGRAISTMTNVIWMRSTYESLDGASEINRSRAVS